MTINYKSIGTASRDHATVASWETTTTWDMKPDEESEVGQMYDDSNFTETTVTIAGAWTDENWHRTLTVGSGEHFDPSDMTGAQFDRSGTLDTLRCNEDAVWIGPGVGFEMTFNGSPAGLDVEMLINQGDPYWTCEGCAFLGDNTGTYNLDGIAILTNYDSSLIFNNVLVSVGTTHIGINYGIWSSTSSSGEIYNNTGDGEEQASSSKNGWYGVYYTGGSETGNKCINNVMIGWDWDFTFAGSFTTNDYNCSGDTTATGTNSLNSKTAADNWTDAANGDYTVKDTGADIYDAGDELNSIFTSSYNGVDRGSANWDMGAFAYSAPATYTVLRAPENPLLRR